MTRTNLFLSSLLKQRPYFEFLSLLAHNLTLNNVEFAFLDYTNDIWCRDFMPIQVAKDEFVRFSLTKDYYLKKDQHKQTDPAPICKELGINPTFASYQGTPIYLDGGNIIRNFGKAIITEKVFANKNIPRDDLAKMLQDLLQVEQIIFIPIETDDDTGHADGMVRFVNERTVVANDYSKVNVAQNFRNRFYGTLAGNGLDVLLVPYNPVNQKINGYWAAIGCYINFLQVGKKIFLPIFDDPVNDEAAFQRFGEIFGVGNIIPVPSREVALGGGVLNCLSWEIF